MKKKLALLLGITLAASLALSACGGTDTPASGGTSTPTDTPAGQPSGGATEITGSYTVRLGTPTAANISKM